MLNVVDVVAAPDVMEWMKGEQLICEYTNRPLDITDLTPEKFKEVILNHYCNTFSSVGVGLVDLDNLEGWEIDNFLFVKKTKFL
jgi:hypothetical protein